LTNAAALRAAAFLLMHAAAKSPPLSLSPDRL
jgi:hypothetical protein